MSVRDTGWVDETFVIDGFGIDGSWVRRIGDVATLRVGADGDWWGVYLPQEEVLRGEAGSVDAAKRAAEDALLDLCDATAKVIRESR